MRRGGLEQDCAGISVTLRPEGGLTLSNTCGKLLTSGVSEGNCKACIKGARSALGRAKTAPYRLSADGTAARNGARPKE